MWCSVVFCLRAAVCLCVVMMGCRCARALAPAIERQCAALYGHRRQCRCTHTTHTTTHTFCADNEHIVLDKRSGRTTEVDGNAADCWRCSWSRTTFRNKRHACVQPHRTECKCWMETYSVCVLTASSPALSMNTICNMQSDDWVATDTARFGGVCVARRRVRLPWFRCRVSWMACLCAYVHKMSLYGMRYRNLACFTELANLYSVYADIWVAKFGTKILFA